MRCPKCSNNTDQTPIGRIDEFYSLNLSNSDEVIECDKCQTCYCIIIFEDRNEANQYTESHNGEVM